MRSLSIYMRQVKEIRYLDIYMIRTRNKAEKEKTGDDLNITRPPR